MFNTASLQDRVLARLIDLVFYLPLLFWYLHLPNEASTLPFLLGSTLSILTLEYLIPLLTSGKTIGQMARGIRMVSLDGGKASKMELLDKSLFYILLPTLILIPALGNVIKFLILCFCILSIITFFKDRYNQTGLDKLANVVLVKEVNPVC